MDDTNLSIVKVDNIKNLLVVYLHGSKMSYQEQEF